MASKQQIQSQIDDLKNEIWGLEKEALKQNREWVMGPAVEAMRDAKAAGDQRAFAAAQKEFRDAKAEEQSLRKQAEALKAKRAQLERQLQAAT